MAGAPRTNSSVPIGVVRMLQTIAERFPVAMITTNAEGSITSWNLAATALYGWRADEVLGRSILDVITNATNSSTADQIMAAIGRGDVWFGGFDCVHADGSTIGVQVIDLPVIDDDGQFCGVIGFSQPPPIDRSLHDDQLQQMRELAERLEDAQVAEQERIGALLHDRLSQPIAMAATELLSIAHTSSLDPTTTGRIRSIAGDLQHSLEILQHLATSLRPDWDADLPASIAIDEMARSWANSAGIPIRILIDPRADGLDREITLTLLRILKESLANIERHADATLVTVQVSMEDQLVVLRVTDDGRGFDGAIGFGIRLMRERARRVGGSVSVVGFRAPRSGSEVEFLAPTTTDRRPD